MKLLIALVLLLGVVADSQAKQATDAERAQARSMFADLIAMKSAEGLGQVPEVAKYLAAKLQAGGFDAKDIHIFPVGETASLVVRYRGDGSGGRPILLLAHMDVVSANPSDWVRDPYKLIEEDGYFFGRGTSDIKNQIAVIVSTFLRLKHEGFVPTRDLIIVFTGDEETSQATTRDLVENHRDLIDAEFALNGDGGGGVLDEATGKAKFIYLQGAEKTSATYSITAHNPGGHSSEPRQKNAIYDLADALRALQAYRFPVKSNEWTRGSLAATGAQTPGELGQAMIRFAADPTDTAAADILATQPSYVGRTRTTCVATMLNAGHAENALPQTATATVNCRIFPGTSIEAIKTELQGVVGDQVEVGIADRTLEALASPPRDDLKQAVGKAAQANYPGVVVVPDQAPYYTDGSIFRAAGIPTYGVNGTFMKNSDSFAHGLNERIPVASFYNDLGYWYVLIKELAGKPKGAAD
ncbi:MAG TPA: M20/M25/M40 family metallo-hydrolase [Dokdonella sp.]|uniref:M20/M25/M40 family metallo-hydrolase n=1 Tax=Dokdonella sp. TaxID=2291710 RepID=UPI002D7E4723|nr:M20/M25/M40 family metallo-hydrolase [Dokdonella sp.]HET9031601.1 M20/M25/M40 family metallo-hydrolase [Dokdonella sp.]